MLILRSHSIVSNSNRVVCVTPGRVRFEYIKIQINTLKLPLLLPSPLPSAPPKYMYKIMFDRKKKFIENSEKIQK